MNINIIVCVKQVPASSKTQVDPETGLLMRSGAESRMNPYDLFAIETALQLKQRYGGQVTALTMGPPQAEAVIREAFALGADDGVLATDRRFAGADVLATSYTLSQAINRLGAFDLILCGKQTTDGDTAQVGSELAERLGIPSAANVSSVRMENGRAAVTYEINEYVFDTRITLPCLICVDKDICTPRLPSYVRRQASAGLRVHTLTLDDMPDKDPSHYGLDGSPTQVKRIFPPEIEVIHEVWRESPSETAGRLTSVLADLGIV
ncbi:MAG: electron transfer flavoprotein subunit beta/FixA family protein [Clostridiales bacterium]|jgi:electron transfer flavoprotein beta subunit|nr:electron transfer flavoprotein subunit beta/FixA family protein [Clostridiales bacterium]